MTDCYFLGTDEAGYGPNLGPLVVSATCWKMTLTPDGLPEKKDSGPRQPTLFDSLEEEDSPSSTVPQGGKDEVHFAWDEDFLFPSERGITELNRRLSGLCAARGTFPVIDSKRLYHSGNLAPLERSFFLALRLLFDTRDTNPVFRELYGDRFLAGMTDGSSSFQNLIEFLSPGKTAELSCHTDSDVKDSVPPWEKEVDFSLPITRRGDKGETDDDDVDLYRTKEVFQASDVSLLGILSRRIQPADFNRLLERFVLKSELLAEVTFSTVAELVNVIRGRLATESSLHHKKEDGTKKKNASSVSSQKRILSCQKGMLSKHPAILLLCDKLGGRNRYGDLLVRFFPDIPFQTVKESRPLSVYRALIGEATGMEIRFQAKGEMNLPTALASITSKYLREISMLTFNDFWRARVTDLRPTAGYPLDAKRFRNDTEPIRSEMNLSDHLFWRNK